MADSKQANALSGGEFAGIGFQFAAVVLVFTGIGYWLDRRLGTSPWLLVLGVFAGAAGGIWSMYQKVTAVQQREASERQKRKQG